MDWACGYVYYGILYETEVLWYIVSSYSEALTEQGWGNISACYMKL